MADEPPAPARRDWSAAVLPTRLVVLGLVVFEVVWGGGRAGVLGPLTGLLVLVEGIGVSVRRRNGNGAAS